MSVSASPALPATVLAWSRGLASLSPGAVPCRDHRPNEWCKTDRRRSDELFKRWRMQAHSAGWETLWLFGVSPEFGAVRGDWKGQLIPLAADVTDKLIRIGPLRVFLPHPIKQLGMIPIWSYGR
ncbi:hypothetical protein [Methylobacterium terrae]|uniref:hypothetical protein n=1 Tax=Methylobacterium terrae TaxID=2202827 RepID=UPI001ABF614A|nr:hypothetical protein [Methylobacterium terrae]